MAKTSKVQAAYCLGLGALGVGEDHTDDKGRQLVIELILYFKTLLN